MKKIKLGQKKIVLVDDAILDFFEKEVTPHGTGAKIPCSSKYIGKKAYVVIANDKKNKKRSKKDHNKN
ncbi:MAG: DUF2080 family transposase-associated protein [archaeon]